MSRYKEVAFSNPVKPEELEAAYAAGMPRPEDLVDRAFYSGHCRNASESMWLAEHKLFIYRRHKFGSQFLEDIHHPAHDNGFDIFVPEARVEVSTELQEFFNNKLPSHLEWLNQRKGSHSS